jgi:hypothetical protein
MPGRVSKALAEISGVHPSAWNGMTIKTAAQQCFPPEFEEGPRKRRDEV